MWEANGNILSGYKPRPVDREALALLMDTVFLEYERGYPDYLPSPADFEPFMNGIERDVFMVLREYRLPFIPQYKVGRRWCDFGDPYTRIDIEIDGQAFHDRESDKVRDKEMEGMGWTTIRISGETACRRHFDGEECDLPSIDEVLTNLKRERYGNLTKKVNKFYRIGELTEYREAQRTYQPEIKDTELTNLDLAEGGI